MLDKSLPDFSWSIPLHPVPEYHAPSISMSFQKKKTLIGQGSYQWAQSRRARKVEPSKVYVSSCSQYPE